MGKFLVLFLLFFNVCFSSHAQIYTDGWNDSKIEFVSHSASENVNAADMYGKAHIITGAYTETLPAAVVGMHGLFRASTAAAFSLDCNGSDHFEMFDGTVMSAGQKQTSGGTKNEWIYVVCESANTWITYSVNGPFTNGG